jgi:hypothetical protein
VASKDPAITELETQLRALDAALKSVQQGAGAARAALGLAGDKAEDAGKKVKTLGERFRAAALELAGIEKATKEHGRAVETLATAFKNLATEGLGAALEALGEWIRAIPESAARADAHAEALAALGSAYAEVQHATNGVVTAEQALTVQQRAAQSGLRLSAQELAAVTQRAREYARTTHTDLGQALEQLTDQLVNPGEELSRFGIRLRQGMDAGDAMREALRQLTTQAGQTGTATRTLAESHEDLNRALTETNDALSAAIAERLELNDFFTQMASWLREATSATSEWSGALNTVVGTLREAIGLRAEVGEQRAPNQSTSGTFVAQAGPLLQELRASGVDTRAYPQLGQFGVRASEEQRARFLAALRRDVERVRAANGNPNARSIEGGGVAVDAAVEEPTNPADVLFFDNAIAELNDLAAQVDQQFAKSQRASATAASEAAAARRREIARRNAASQTPTSASELEQRRANWLDFQFSQARGAPVSSDWASAFMAAMQRQGARQIEGRSPGAQLEGIDMQRRSREAQLAVGRGGEGDFDPTTRGGQEQARREHITVLREQREALVALLTEAEREEQLARESGASQSEVNELLRARIGVQQALATTTRDLTAATAENSRHLVDFRDKMADVASGMAGGFAEAAVAALDGAKSFDQAIGEMLRSTLKSVAQMAIVEALKNTALGIGHLASFNYAGAANAFAAAGAWVAVGAAAGVAIAATRPSTASAGPSTGMSTTARGDVASRPDRSSSGGGPLNLTVVVSGAIFETRHEVLQGVSRGVRDAVAHGYLAPGVFQ